MKNSIMLALLCAIAIFAVACGSGNNASGNKAGNEAGKDSGGETAADPQAQWDALYKEGANWTMKMDFGSAMLQKTEVVSVKDGVAKIKTSMKMGDADWMAPTDGEAKRPEKADPNAKPAEGYKELGKGSEKVKDWDTNWVESEMGGKKTKTWMSTKYGAVVKMEQDGKVVMELQELNAK